MSIHGHEAGGMGPWSHRTLFQLAPAHFPHPLPKPPHGGTVLCMAAARPMREAIESGGYFCIPSAPAARPLGNVRCCAGRWVGWGRGGSEAPQKVCVPEVLLQPPASRMGFGFSTGKVADVGRWVDQPGLARAQPPLLQPRREGSLSTGQLFDLLALDLATLLHAAIEL